MFRGRGRGRIAAASRGGPRLTRKSEGRGRDPKQKNILRGQAIPPTTKPDARDSEESDDDFDAQLNTDPQSLYSKLLSSLSGRGGAFAQALKHRQRDEAGGSDDDDDDDVSNDEDAAAAAADDDDDGSADGKSDDENNYSSDAGGESGEEGDDVSDDDGHDSEAKHSDDDHEDDGDDSEDDGSVGESDEADGADVPDEEASQGSQEEEEEPMLKPGGKGMGGKKRKHGSVAAAKGDGEVHEGQPSKKGRSSRPSVAKGAGVEKGAQDANGMGAAFAGEDDEDDDKAGTTPSAWSVHVNHVMTQADVAALTTAQAQRRAYRPVAAVKGVKNAQWMASGAASSEPPQELPSLWDYGIKLSLLRKWRQLRAEAGGAVDSSADAAHTNANGADSTQAGDKVQKKKGEKKREENKGGEEATATAAVSAAQGMSLEKPTVPDFVSAQQQQFFTLLHSYADVQFPCAPLVRSPEALATSYALTDAWLLHALDHVLKSQAVIQRHNAQQQRKAQEAAERRRQEQEQARTEGKKGRKKKKGSQVVAGEAPAWEQGPIEEGPSQDQGFTRPQVLLLLPMRSAALRVVRRLVELMPLSHAPEGFSRLLQEFGDPDDDEGHLSTKGTAQEGEAARLFGDGDKQQGERGKRQGEGGFMLTGAKPPDYRHLFSGNSDDHFRFGIKLTKKSMKLFAPFYDSDIVVASPLGLVTRINEADEKGQTDVDFLSSIQILVLQMTDVMYMQNWAHVQTVVEHVNQLPSTHHGADIMRIREWFLNGWGKFYRQTVILSSFTNADMNALFNRTCTNFKGKYKLRSEHEGVLGRVVPQVRQIFERFPCASITDADDARFTFFTNKVYPRLRDSVQSGVLLFVPLYFDYVKLRNFLKKEEAPFCSLCEYTEQSDISRARTLFFRGERRFMLYTERAHFYRRFRIRGIRELVFYSLPEHSHFYAEMLNLLEGQDNLSCTVLFNRFDNLQLERIVGSSRATRMIKSDKNVFMFVDQ